jgi:hypothetical protein
MKCERVCLFLLLVFCCLGNAAGTAEPNSVPRQGWKTTLSYNNWMDTEPAVMKIQDGYFVTGISHHKTDSGKYEYKVVLWKIDLQGKELWVKDINLPARQASRSFVAERCFALQDEPTLLLVSASTLQAWLLRFGDTGTMVFSKEFSAQQVFDIQGLKKTNDGLFLYGSVHKTIYQQEPNSDACVTKLDPNGNEIWRREYDKGKMEWGIGLAPLKDGGFVLSADSGNYNKFGAGPSECWIIKCDPNGNILSETIFDGRHPSVTTNGDVTAVVFNKENFPQQDMAVVGLDGELKTLWRIDSLFGKTNGTGMLKTIVNKQGDFVIAGNKSLAAEIWKVGKDGKIIGELEVKDANLCVQFESLLQTPTGYLVAGNGLTMSKMPLTADGKVAKGTKWDSMDILVTEVADLTK